MIYLIAILLLEVMFKPRVNWNYETKRLMLWYTFNNKRNYIQL